MAAGERPRPVRRSGLPDGDPVCLTRGTTSPSPALRRGGRACPESGRWERGLDSACHPTRGTVEGSRCVTALLSCGRHPAAPPGGAAGAGRRMGHVPIAGVRLGPAACCCRARRVGLGRRARHRARDPRGRRHLRPRPLHSTAGWSSAPLLHLAASSLADHARRGRRPVPGRRPRRGARPPCWASRPAPSPALAPSPPTPALAAASARAPDPAAPAIGYSITYLDGVVLMLAVAAWTLPRPARTPSREIGHVAVPVEVDEPMTCRAWPRPRPADRRLPPEARARGQPDDRASRGRD